MFPTLVKNKISHTHSYPLTAKEISEALANAPQSEFLKIAFYSGWQSIWAAGNSLLLEKFRQGVDQYSVAAVVYGRFRNQQTNPEGSIGSVWQVAVGPVPRVKRHVINQMLKSEGLPAMQRWLEARQGLASAHGSQAVLVTFLEEKDSLEIQHHQSPGETFQND